MSKSKKKPVREFVVRPADAPTRYVELVRVSSQGQADAGTPDAQRSALDRLRKSRPGVLVKRIEALAVSGAAPLAERDDLQELFKLLAVGGVDEVRLYTLDRLTRSGDGVERAMIYRELKEGGAKIVTVDGRVLDPAAPGEGAHFTELMVSLEGWVASGERLRILRRTFEGKRRCAALGYMSHGTAPFGLRWDVEAKQWILVEAEAVIVKQIFQWADADDGTQTIADKLNAAGVLSPRNSRWGSSQITQMLKNASYRGEYLMRIGPEVFKLTPPAIIASDLWERVQQGLARRLSRPKVDEGAAPALCRGRAKCGVCGRTMCVLSAKGRKYIYYECASRNRRHASAPCANPNHPAKLVDAAVWNVVVSYLRDPKLLRDAVAGTEVRDTASWESQIANAEKRLAKFGREEAEIIRNRTADLISEEAARQRLTEMKRERDILKQTIEVGRSGIQQREAAASAMAAVEDRLETLKSNLDSPDFATQRALIEAVVPALDGYGIVLNRDGSIEIRGALDLSRPSGNDDGRVSEGTKSSTACVAAPGASSPSLSAAPWRRGS